MKKVFALVLTVLILSGIMAVSAYVPADGDFQNVWGMPGAEVGNASASGIPLTWIKADGGMWAARLSYANPVKLDGLVIKLKNVVMANDNAGLALGFGGDVGQWVDSKGLFILNFNQKKLDTTDLQYGYILSKTGADMSDKKPRFIEATPTTKKIGGDLTISFKKNTDGTWNYVFNGQTVKIKNADVIANITDVNNCYLSFGTWVDNDLSFIVSEITSSGSTVTSSKPASSSKFSSKAASTSKSTAATSTTSNVSTTSDEVIASQDNSTDTSSEELSTTNSTETSSNTTDGTSSSNLLVPIIIIVVLLLGCGVGIFFIMKAKKTK